MSDNPITITRKVGKFTFDPATPMGLCRLVCDTVQGQMLNPKDRTAAVETEQQAKAFVKASDSLVLGGLVFDFEMSAQFKDNRLDKAIRRLVDGGKNMTEGFRNLANEFHMSTYAIRQLAEAMKS